MPTNYGGFSGLAKLKGNPYGIGGFNATLPPEAYSGGVSPRYQTSVNPVGGPAYGPVQGPGYGSGYGSTNTPVYDPFTRFTGSYYDAANNLSPAASGSGSSGGSYSNLPGSVGSSTNPGGIYYPVSYAPSGKQYFQFLTDPNDDAYVGSVASTYDYGTPGSHPIPSSGDVYFPSSGDASVRRGLPIDSSGTTDLSNAPMVTPEGYIMPQTAGASSVPGGYITPGTATAISPYPLPGGFYQPKPSFFGGLLDKLLGRNRPPPNTPTSSFDPTTGMNWVNSATNTDAFGNPVGMDASGYPLPGGGPGGPTAPNWAINASRPTQPWGFGPNYVDPREANAFFGGLANWNAGAATQGFSGAGEAGLGGLGRGPVTAKGLAQAAFLRGGGGGAVQGMAGKIK